MWDFIAPVPPRLAMIAFIFCQPLLLNTFLSYLQDPLKSDNYGYGLIGAYGFVYFGIAVGFPYTHMIQCLTTI
jgi:hypothetical protein